MKRNKPFVLGLTGGIACGKSHVAAELRALGVPVLDADAISRALTAPGGEALPAVREDVASFAGKAEQFYDITMLGFAYYGEEGRQAP